MASKIENKGGGFSGQKFKQMKAPKPPLKTRVYSPGAMDGRMDGPKGVTVIERVIVERDWERDSERKERERKKDEIREQLRVVATKPTKM